MTSNDESSDPRPDPTASDLAGPGPTPEPAPASGGGPASSPAPEAAPPPLDAFAEPPAAPPPVHRVPRPVDPGPLPQRPPASGYYAGGERKVVDFFIGFLGVLFIAPLFVFLAVTVANSARMDMAPVAFSLVGLVVFVFALFWSFTAGRKWIAIGMISISAIPIIGFLLLLGACYMHGGFGI